MAPTFPISVPFPEGVSKNTIVFDLPSLDFTSEAVAALFAGVSPQIRDADVYLSTSLTVSQVQQMFMFYTDSLSINTGSVPTDLQYKLNNAFAQDLSGVVSVAQSYYGGFRDNLQANDDGVTKYVQINATAAVNTTAAENQFVYTALKLFNVCAGAALFTNEAGFVADFKTNANTALSAALLAISNLGTIGWTSAGSFVSGSILCPSETILQNIIQSDPDRLIDLTVLNDGTGSNHFYMPILVGDSIEFIMTVHAALNQELTNGANPAGSSAIQSVIDIQIPSRTYRINVSVVA